MPSKRDRFVTLAEKRMVRTIKDIRLIGNLSNRSSYDYTEDDARKIVFALEEEVKLLRSKFEDKGDGDSVNFSLSDPDAGMRPDSGPGAGST